MDVGEDTTAGDRDVAEELVELLVVADGELDVARDDAAALVIGGPIALGGRRSLAALPASSRSSAVRYSRTAAMCGRRDCTRPQTEAPAPTRLE